METLGKHGRGFMIHSTDGLRMDRVIETPLELLLLIKLTNLGVLDLSALEKVFKKIYLKYL